MGAEFDRRDFLRISSASTAGLAPSADGSAQQAAASAKPVRLGSVTAGGRGPYHLDCALGMDGVEVAGGSVPLPFPDFTKGKWKTAKPLDIA